MYEEVPMTTPIDPRHPAPSPAPAGGRAVWPYLLIGAGILLLASNFGWFSFGALWSLLNLWPVALIAAGVDVITSGRYRLAVVAVAVAVALVWWAADLRGGGGERVEVTHGLDGARAAAVVLRLGVGDVAVDAAAVGGDLLTGTIQAGRGETIVQRPSRSGDTARVEIASQSSGPISVTGADPRRWNLSLTREVPVDLRVEAGVGRAVLDLRAATLTALSYGAGVGETIVTLSERGGYRAEFELGVGATTLRIPEAVEARVTLRTGLGRASVSGGFDRVDDVATTPGFAAAAPDARIEVSVQGGVGAITVQRVR